MFCNTPSIAVAQQRLRSFVPPYCANPQCPWHKPENISSEKPFQRFGAAKVLRFPYISPRFRCVKCRRTFSSSFFSLIFRDRKNDHYEHIFKDVIDGLSKRKMAHDLGWDEDTIRRKIKKMCRHGLLLWARDLEKVQIRESVAYDGLENFSYSQYDPNNVNHAVGRESLFIYDFNLSPMNRKGRTSPRQKIRRNYLNELHGKYDSGRIQADSAKIFERLLSKSSGELLLHSDNHFAYRKALQTLKGRARIVHFITPSKVHRNFRNRLFSINHTDLLSRHDVCAFKRETIGFSKHTIAMQELFLLFAIKKNYMRTQFTKKQVRNPLANKQSPAMAVGLCKKVLSFKEFFCERLSVHHLKLCDDWQDLFDSFDRSSRRFIRPYCGI